MRDSSSSPHALIARSPMKTFAWFKPQASAPLLARRRPAASAIGHRKVQRGLGGCAGYSVSMAPSAGASAGGASSGAASSIGGPPGVPLTASTYGAIVSSSRMVNPPCRPQ